MITLWLLVRLPRAYLQAEVFWNTTNPSCRHCLYFCKTLETGKVSLPSCSAVYLKFSSVWYSKDKKKEARASPLSWGNHFHPTSPGMLSGCWRSTATQGQIQGMHLIYLTETSSSDLWSLTQLDMGWGAVLKTSLRRWLSSTRQFENHWFPHKKAGTQGLR